MIITTRGMRWLGHVIYMREINNGYISVRDLNLTYRFEDLDVDGRIILKCYSVLWGVKLSIVSHYFEIGSHDERSKQVKKYDSDCEYVTP
jgi:hypothetical protein